MYHHLAALVEKINHLFHHPLVEVPAKYTHFSNESSDKAIFVIIVPCIKAGVILGLIWVILEAAFDFSLRWAQFREQREIKAQNSREDDAKATEKHHEEVQATGEIEINGHDRRMTFKQAFKNIKAELRCAICHGYFRAPLTLTCSHRYCTDCWKNYARNVVDTMVDDTWALRVRQRLGGYLVRCPLCQQRYVLKVTNGNANLIPSRFCRDRSLEAIIESIQVICGTRLVPKR